MRSSLTFSPGHDLILIVKFEKVTKLYQRNQLHGTGADLRGGGGGARGPRPLFFLYLWYGMVTLFIHGKSFSNDIKKIKD